MKKVLLIVMALTVVFSLTLAPTVDAAKRGGFGGGYKSPKKSYSPTPTKPADNVNKVEPGKTTTTPGVAKPGTTNPNRGFFTGGGLMRGLMIGGIAGLLFGTMFANLGAFGDFLGLLVNVLAIYILFIAIRGIYRYMKNQNKPNPNDSYRR
jgi:predicted lipid-binding transport protein (Tim44 family)